ncbi:MAG TPA: hypothetical protein VD969_19710 [Symbiobacteriaceae bacterium]|nr:hypothetical protein [Symbiobacteriaceae bacterium]
MVKVPASTLRVIEDIFFAAYLLMGTEERVMIYVDQSGQILLRRPPGDRGRAHVDCDLELTIEAQGRQWDLAYDFHSHHVMGCGFSGVDDANERIRGVTFGVFSWAGGLRRWKFRRWGGPADGFEGLPIEEVVVDG